MLWFLFFLTIIYCFWKYLKHRRLMISTSTSDNVLFVTAHPDDELMFFGPTLLNEIRLRTQHLDKTNDCFDDKQSKVHLLCLSSGNYYGDGKKRVQELNDACKCLLKFCLKSQENFQKQIFIWQIFNDEKLIDSPSHTWPAEYIENIVKDYIQKNQITKLITFDHYGISGHKNHIAIYEAVCKLYRSIKVNSLNKESTQPELQIWLLESVSLFRKYLAAFDIFFTVIMAWWHHDWNMQIISSLNDYLNIVYALRQHRSQMLWFRYLYSSTSRYMFINTLKLLNY